MKRIPNPKKMKRIKGPVLTEEEFQSAKVRITTYLDEDVLRELRRRARDSSGKYQSVLNRILREHLFDERNNLLTRLERLEKAVFERDSV